MHDLGRLHRCLDRVRRRQPDAGVKFVADFAAGGDVGPELFDDFKKPGPPRSEGRFGLGDSSLSPGPLAQKLAFSTRCLLPGELDERVDRATGNPSCDTHLVEREAAHDRHAKQRRVDYRLAIEHVRDPLL